MDNTKNFTQSGESLVPQEIRSTSDFLPDVINTKTNKKFLESTLDQLMSSGTMEPIDSYWGKVSGSTFVYNSDYYNHEKTQIRQNYQFAPGFSYTENETTNAVSYINIINSLQNVGYDVSDIDRLYSAQGFTLDLPINNDMFINYNNYYWMDGDIPVCEIIPTAQEPISLEDILKTPNYKTPTLSNGKILTFINGMRVSFNGDYVLVGTTDISKNAVYIVGGVGEKIYLVEEINNVGKNIRPSIVPYTMQNPTQYGQLGNTVFSYDDTLYIPVSKEYIVIDPTSTDANPWSRINRWMSKYAISEIAYFNGIQFGHLATLENKGKRPIIQFNANMAMYNSGTSLIETVEHVFDCNFTINPAVSIQGASEYIYNENTILLDNELIMFLNSPEQTYSNNIFLIRFVGGEINLLQLPYIIADGDKILTKTSNVSSYIGSEFYWSGDSWIHGQQKTNRGAAPLFQLYDDNGIYLNTYLNSNFYGDKIFSYITSDTAVIDSELGINAKTNSQSPTEFMFSLSDARYGTTVDTVNYNSIEGYYYYKNTKTNKLVSMWKPIRNTQRVNAIETIVVDEDNFNVTFELDQSIALTDKYIATKEGSYYRWFTYDKVGIYSCGCKSDIEFLQKNKEYTITQLMESADYISFYDPFGNVSSEINYSTTGSTITLNIAESYSYSSLFYRNSSNTVNGIVYISHKSNELYCYKNGELLTGPNSYILTEGAEYVLTQTDEYLLTENTLPENDYTIISGTLALTTQANAGDVIEIYYVTDDKTKAHDVSPLFKYNILNEEPTEMSYSNIYTHLADQLVKHPSFIGSFSSDNNYHYIPKTHTYGGTIRQQPYSPAIHSVLSSRELTEPTAALRETSLDYANFKLYFASKVKQLWNTNTWDSVQEIVDEALTQINIGKTSDFKYANSDMVYYGGGKNTTYSITTAVTTFELNSEIHSRGYNKIHTYVWISEKVGTNYIKKILKNETDYTISGKTLTLIYSPTYTLSIPAIITIEQYVEEAYSFVPFSSVKLGLEKPYDVKINNNKLELHDGSFYNVGSADIFDLYSSTFDVVGAALYELEMRILGNLPQIHKTVDNVTAFAPRFNTYGSVIAWNEFKDQLTTEFYYWKNNVNYGENTVITHNPSDEFTWNYSSVGDGIASWRGIYLYNFGTMHPHLHPWEMLGHNTKPSWWDANYSWTDAPKRATLINSLKNGITENPLLSTSYPNPKFAITHYNWDSNILVTTGGVLNGPVTAGVVASPAVTVYANPFNYGDMMFDDELAWMETSEYSYSLVIALMKFIPANIFETYNSIGGMVIKDNVQYHNLQYVNSDINKRANPTKKKIHSEINKLSGIVSVKIQNGGSNYSANTKVEALISPTGERATFVPTIVSGSIVALTITDPGFGYKNDTQLIITDPTNAGSGANIVGVISTIDTVFIIPGLMATIVEYNNGITSPADIKTMIESIKFTPIIHLGGYSTKYNIDIRLDGSYRKGKVSVPKEDFSIVLNKNPAINSKFYSGIRVEKTQTNSFRVWGYNNIDPEFFVYFPNEAGAAIPETIGTYTLSRYMKFKNVISSVKYGTEFIKRQDLYNFLMGLGQYYATVGFDVDWKTAAAEIIAWSLDSTLTDDIYRNGIIKSTLTFSQGTHGVVDQFLSYKNKTIKLLDKDANSIPSKDVLIIRNQTTTEITQKDQAVELYGVAITVCEYEHVIALNQVSQFGDIIYDSVLGISQHRVKVVGERTRNWNGRIEANGYIVSNDSIFGNFETTVREIERDVVNSQGHPLDKNISKTSRFNVGYIEPSYLSLVSSNDNASYQFSIGERNNKGTEESLKAFTRNSAIFQGNVLDYELSENWMVRLGDYGDKRKANPIQVEIDKAKLKTNPQAVRFNEVVRRDRLDDSIIDISKNDVNYISGNFKNPISMLPIQTQDLGKNELYTKAELAKIFENYLANSGLPLTTEVTHSTNSVDNIRYMFDSTADYATINNWASSVIYRQGDRVRLNGKVYELLINSTQLQYGGDELYMRGSVSLPTVNSGKTFIVGTNESNAQTITFNKTGTQTTYAPIVVNGSISNPTTASNNTLVIDGKTITLQKTDNSTVYEPIVYTATESFPSVSGTSGKTLIVDGLTIDLHETITTYDPVIAVEGLTAAFTAVKHPYAMYVPITLASVRIYTFRYLSFVYQNFYSTTAWTSFVNNYFINPYTTDVSQVGLNIPFLLAEKAASTDPTLDTWFDNLIQIELDIINAVGNTSYTVGTITNSAINDVINTITGNATAYVELETFSYALQSSTLISNNTIIRTVINNYPKDWNASLLADKLNSSFVAAGKSRLSASVSPLNQVVITKAAIIQDNSLVIGVGTANTEIGFPLTVTTVTSTVAVPSTIVTLPEIVGLINLAGINNVRASVGNGNVLTITSVNPTLSVTNATANTDVGLVVNQYAAQSTAITTSAILQVYDIIQQINLANIPNIVASNINNAVLIQSTGSGLFIGNGTANVDIGFSSVILEQSEYIDNQFITANWKEISEPADLKIWVQDNTTSSSNVVQNKLTGYNVYQVFDIQLNITNICQGIYSDDNVMITVNQDIELPPDSFVMVINSNSVPKVNGIHRVLQQTQANSFIVDAYVDSHGSAGKVLLLLPTRFPTTTELYDTIDNAIYATNGLGWKAGMLAYVDYVVDDPDEDGNGRGAVYQCVTDTLNNNIYFEIIRYQEKKTNNYEIKNAIIFNDSVNMVNYLEVFDPAKGIIPGIADNEIDYKSPYDVAEYTNSTDQYASIGSQSYWAGDKVGKVWWDMRNAIYLDYEQDTYEYRQSNWGKLYPTGSIDIYEWTRSPFTPDDYNRYSFTNTIVDGIQITGEARYENTTYGDIVYSWTEETVFDPVIGTEKTYYYFWVKQKTTVPNTSRTYSITQLSQIIADPTSFGIQWIAFSDADTVLLGNIENSIVVNGSVLQINYKNENTTYHQEYTLLGEKNTDTNISEWLHVGLRDSIVGEDKSIYDFPFTEWNNNVLYNAGDVIKYDGLFYTAIQENIALRPINDSSSEFWKNLYSAIETFNDANQTTMTRVSAPRQVPDIWLHRYSRYGNLVSPRQSWITDTMEARRIYVEKVNRQLKTINITNEIKNWGIVLNSSIMVDNKTYNVFDYWKFVDWQDETYDHTKKPNLVVATLSDLQNITNPYQGYVVKVSYAYSQNGINNYAIYKYDLGLWKIIYQERGTIQFIDTLWNSYVNGFGWDTISWDRNDWDGVPVTVLCAIIDTIKDDIFVEQYKSYYIDLWFAMIKYILSEQNSVDWVVKTTLADFAVKYAIEQKKLYIPDMASGLIDYFNSVKPFHTKLKNFTIKRTIQDDFIVAMEEVGRTTDITIKHDNVIPESSIFTELVLSGGTNWETTDNVDYSLNSTTVYDYIYNGNSFDQLVYQDWPDELFPADFVDAARILITRNTSGSVEDVNTKHHIVFSNDVDHLTYSNATTLDKTTVAVSIAKTDTSITVVDATKLYDPVSHIPDPSYGIIWINGERITYRNISGNTLLNCTRGTQGTVANTHSVDDVVYSGNNIFEPTYDYVSYVWDSNTPPTDDTWDSTVWDSTNIPVLKLI